MKVFIYGASGHGKVIADILLAGRQPELGGFVDDDPGRVGKDLLGFQVQSAGTFGRAREQATKFQVIVGIGDNLRRKQVAERMKKQGIGFAAAIHPRACIGREVDIGEGSVIMAGAVINPGARIGRHVIINTGAVVDHDCRIGDYAHLSPGSSLAGGVQVGALVQVGIGAAVLPNVRIGDGAVIGACAAVTSDVPPDTVFGGVPAKDLHGRIDRSE